MNRLNFRNLKNQPYITLSFLSIQTAVFLLAYLFPSLLIEFRGSMFGPSIVYNQEYWRFLTPMFIHFGLMHFAVNSVVLYFMGQQIEAIYGHWRFFGIYIMSGVLGNVLSFAFNDPRVQSVGSSTALFGMFGAFAVLGYHFKNNYAIQAMVRQFALFVGLSFIFGMFDQSIDLLGHIGGLIGGVLMGNLVGFPPRIGKTYSIHVKVISALILVFCIGFCLFYGFQKYHIV